MNRVGFALSVVAVVASAAWAYHINYNTKTTLGRVDKLRGQIAAEREAVEVLRVEWAYLNTPERLARLVAMHNDVLGLEPISPQGFDEVATIPYPPRVLPPGPQPDTGEGARGLISSEMKATGNSAQQDPPTAVLAAAVPAPSVAERAPVPAPRPVAWRLQ